MAISILVQVKTGQNTIDLCLSVKHLVSLDKKNHKV